MDVRAEILPPPRLRQPSVLHVDLDAFFAAVEQRDKPSLRGKPVVVGGLGPRGVVSTASYEAREFGVNSAIPTAQARARCPHAAYLYPRARVYRVVSDVVMGILRELSDVIEPLSLDEAFVDLTHGATDVPEPLTAEGVRARAERVRATIREQTGVTASVGAGTSKLVAKIASEQAKPDGVVVVPAGDELGLLHPLPIRALPGVGPVTATELARLGVVTIGDLAGLAEYEVISAIGESHGRSLHQLSLGNDDRPVSSERESKSISYEDTFDTDITNPSLLTALVERMAQKVTERLSKAGASGRTVTLKARLHDFTTLSRSATLPGPTDDVRQISRLATRLLGEIDATNGVRLLGVGVSGLSDWVQDDLFATADPGDPSARSEPNAPVLPQRSTEGAPVVASWVPGMDVVHAEHGRGWVWGSGVGRVTVRFETADTPPGPVLTFATDDPALTPFGQR